MKKYGQRRKDQYSRRKGDECWVCERDNKGQKVENVRIWVVEV